MKALTKRALGWLAPTGRETVAPGKRSAARGNAFQQFKSPERATDVSIALPGLIPLIAQTPGRASLARSYSLSALPGRRSLSTSRTQVYKTSKLLTNAGKAEHSHVSPPAAVSCHKRNYHPLSKPVILLNSSINASISRTCPWMLFQ